MNANRDQQALCESIRAAEQLLAEFYGFVQPSRAEDFLVAEADLRSVLARHGEKDAPLPRAGVFMLPGDDDELFIGVSFDKAVGETLRDHPPVDRLDDANLDAFCVVAEETSHFHLLVARANTGLGVSRLELEWQGEVDKFLVCAMLLQQQCGKPHLHELVHRLFDEAKVTQPDGPYEQATKHGARLWRALIGLLDGMTDPLGSHGLRVLLRAAYAASWRGKLQLIDELGGKSKDWARAV